MRQKGLGKGLNALLSEEAVINQQNEGIRFVDINEIEPNYDQPRKKFDQEELNELMLSIQEHGILQPLIVREKGNKFEIVAGERRYRAARLAKVREIPILVKDFDVVYPSDASTFDLFAFIVPVKVLLTLRACDNDSVTPFPPLPLTPVFQSP